VLWRWPRWRRRQRQERLGEGSLHGARPRRRTDCALPPRARGESLRDRV